MNSKRQTAKGHYDRSAKVLPELEIGQEVRIAGQQNKIWEPGTCVQKLSDRSYLWKSLETHYAKTERH